MNKVVKIFFIVIVCIITHNVGYSQPVTWMKYYDYNGWSDYGIQGIQTFDGGYSFLSISSITDNYLKKNILLTKVDYFGSVEFQKLITDSTPNGLSPTSFAQTSDSGFILAGFSLGKGFLIKTDKFGISQWRKDYSRPGADIAFRTMKITLDKGYICGGEISTPSVRQYIMKTDSLGNKQWDSVYLGFSVRDIVQSSSGYYYTVNGNIFRKLTETGGIIWEIDTNVSGLNILKHPDGFLYLLRGPKLSKYDSSGNFYWAKDYFYKFPPSVYFNDLCLAHNNDIVLCGFISDPYTVFPDLFLTRVDADGVIKYYKILTTGKQDYDYLESVYPTIDNGFICTGVTTFTTTRLYLNTIVVKTDSDFNTTPIVKILQLNSFIPDDFELFQNYPNPFNPTTKIKFNITKFSRVSLNIYDILGNEIEKLVNGNLNPGIYHLIWNGKNFASGIYYYKLKIENSEKVRKMTLLK